MFCDWNKYQLKDKNIGAAPTRWEWYVNLLMGSRVADLIKNWYDRQVTAAQRLRPVREGRCQPCLLPYFPQGERVEVRCYRRGGSRVSLLVAWVQDNSQAEHSMTTWRFPSHRRDSSTCFRDNEFLFLTSGSKRGAQMRNTWTINYRTFSSPNEAFRCHVVLFFWGEKGIQAPGGREIKVIHVFLPTCLLHSEFHKY